MKKSGGSSRGGSSRGGPSNRIEKPGGDSRRSQPVTRSDLSYLHQHLARGDSRRPGQHHQPQGRAFDLSRHLLVGSTETGLGSFLSSGAGMGSEAFSGGSGTDFSSQPPRSYPSQPPTDLNATSSGFSDLASPPPPIMITSPAFSGYENFGGPNPVPDTMPRTPMAFMPFSRGMAERYQPSGGGMSQDTLPYPVPAEVNPPGMPNFISREVYERALASLSSMRSQDAGFGSGGSELPALTDITSVYLPESGGYPSFPQNWDGTTSPYSSAHVSSQASPESRWPFTPSTAMTPTGFEDFGSPRTDLTTPSVSSAYERSLAPSTARTPTGFEDFGSPWTDLTTPPVSSYSPDIQLKDTTHMTPMTAVENRVDNHLTDGYLRSLKEKDYTQYTKVYIPKNRILLEKTSYYIEVGPSSMLNQRQELETFFFHEEKKIVIFIPKDTLSLPKRSYRIIPVVSAIMDAIDSNHIFSDDILSQVIRGRLKRRSGNWITNYVPGPQGS